MPSNWTQILSKYVKKWFIIYIFLQTKNPGVVHKAQGTMASAVYFETSVHHSASSLFSYLLLPSSFSYHDFFFFFCHSYSAIHLMPGCVCRNMGDTHTSPGPLFLLSCWQAVGTGLWIEAPFTWCPRECEIWLLWEI